MDEKILLESGDMNNRKIIYILGEDYPPVLGGIAALQLIVVLKDLNTLWEEQN
jgi:hypothetical protein